MSTPLVAPHSGQDPRPPHNPPTPHNEGTRAAVGRTATAKALRSAGGHHILFSQVVDERTGAPIRGARYEVVAADGKPVATGVTRHDGIIRHEFAKPGPYQVRVLEVE